LTDELVVVSEYAALDEELNAWAIVRLLVLDVNQDERRVDCQVDVLVAVPIELQQDQHFGLVWTHNRVKRGDLRKLLRKLHDEQFVFFGGAIAGEVTESEFHAAQLELDQVVVTDLTDGVVGEVDQLPLLVVGVPIEGVRMLCK